MKGEKNGIQIQLLLKLNSITIPIRKPLFTYSNTTLVKVKLVQNA